LVDIELIKNAITSIIERKHQKNALKELKEKADGLRLVSITKTEVQRQIDCVIRGEDPGDLTLIIPFPESLTEQQKTNLYKIKEIILEYTI
jgi:hypothetical protein